MKISACFVFLFFTFISCFSQDKTSTKASPGFEKIINPDWTFNYFPSETADRGYEAPGYDDSKWLAVSIPHTWSTYETTGELHPFIRNAAESDNPYWWNGWGWYRKHFTVNPAYSDKKVFIEFEGVQKYCKVWINGAFLGDHKGGYGSFDFDVTKHIKKKGDNVIAVAVNNARNDRFRIPPMTAGNFNVYGGIYRDVTITLKNNLYIPMQGSAAHEGGTFITTPGLTGKSGVVRIQTWVKNDNAQDKNCILQTTVIDAAGKIIRQVKSQAEIKAGELYKFDQTTKAVRSPHLWSPEDPYLYKVISVVIDGGTVVDTYTSPLGFRWFRWDYAENMLYVNGKKTLLHGGNRHQEYPWLGDAIPKWITLMDFNDMAENMNYNFMRTAHYPNDRLVYDLTDKLGIIVDEEVPNIKNLDFSPEVQEQQLREMIRRDRNHPSIMIWSMGNETDKAVDSKLAVAEDTTRILTARRVTNGSQGKFARHNDDNLPIENLLRCTVRGWYNTDVKALEPSDEQHSGTEEHQLNMLVKSGLFGAGNLCTWLYEDHGADREYLNAPMLHVNPKGYVDLYRVPKYAYYFWQANYAEKPVMFILPHFWRQQYIGQKKDIVVISNCDKVELMVNGASKGAREPGPANFHTVTFTGITVEDAVLTATGARDGKTVTWKLPMAGEPAKIVLRASHGRIDADRGSVVVIHADIADSKGNHVYGACNTLKWSVSGPAKLVGPEVYVSDINKHHAMEGTWYMDAPVANVIRSTGEPGKIRVSVNAGGLASGAVEILAETANPDNAVITEPGLKNEGRTGVSRIVLQPSRLDEVPREIAPVYEAVSIAATDRNGYKKAIREYLSGKNGLADTTSVEFRKLTELFAGYLYNNGGRLIADDYNFNVDHYNNCRLIAGYVNATKLPEPFKDGLRAWYAKSIIMEGSEKNAGEEMNWLNWIPSGGTVVYCDEGLKTPPVRGALVTSKNELPDIISLVHPAFSRFSAEAKTRALEFIAKMNPYIHADVNTEIINEKKVTTTKLIAAKGKPILIPLYKFIAE